MERPATKRRKILNSKNMLWQVQNARINSIEWGISCVWVLYRFSWIQFCLKEFKRKKCHSHWGDGNGKLSWIRWVDINFPIIWRHLITSLSHTNAFVEIECDICTGCRPILRLWPKSFQRQLLLLFDCIQSFIQREYKCVCLLHWSHVMQIGDAQISTDENCYHSKRWNANKIWNENSAKSFCFLRQITVIQREHNMRQYFCVSFLSKQQRRDWITWYVSIYLSSATKLMNRIAMVAFNIELPSTVPSLLRKNPKTDKNWFPA